ncbi:MAG: MarR family transcriptional regulator [Alphaproteobacteria bacterium]|nr:MarR family transcriptional regulator [Alphaproteobacteria bacterium]
MKESYFESVVMIERLHRLFLEVIKIELERFETRDINNVQALVLYNIGKNQLTVGELTNRGYYLGSNVSYNLRKMVQNKYVVQIPSPHDKRSSHVKLSQKGLDLYARLDIVLADHSTILEKGSVQRDEMGAFCKILRKLETFWTGLLTR